MREEVYWIRDVDMKVGQSGLVTCLGHQAPAACALPEKSDLLRSTASGLLHQGRSLQSSPLTRKLPFQASRCRLLNRERALAIFSA